MSVPVLTFFNNKGGVGKTSLVYHLSWIFSEMGKKVVAVDLDAQANLTSAFLPEDTLEELWETKSKATTIYRCVQPLMEVGDIQEPITKQINSSLYLVPGDLALAGFEDFLSQEWPNSLDSRNLLRAYRVLTAFWIVAQKAAEQHQADLILADVGPNLGAINRSALIGSDYVVIPLAADLFSLQGLRNLGPTLHRWRSEWRKRLDNWPSNDSPLPDGKMTPLGYVVQQYNQRFSRPSIACDRWAARIPGEYRESVLSDHSTPPLLADDPLCLARLKHYRSLVPMAQEARKPIFQLTAADGAIGSHSYGVQEARHDFNSLARKILDRMTALSHPEYVQPRLASE
jgi:cellulose biosynthesis protein BcsQ